MKTKKILIRKYRDSLKKLNIRKRQLKDAKLAYVRAKRYADAPQFLQRLKEKVMKKYGEVQEARAKFKQYADAWGEVEDALLEIKNATAQYEKRFDTKKQMAAAYISAVKQQLAVMQSALSGVEDI